MKSIRIHFVIILSLCMFVEPCQGQLRYSVVGTYKGKSAQGMAIWGDKAYLFNDGGFCRVFNLKSHTVISEFELACAGKNTHVNAACFGKESFEKGGKPVIYISEYKHPSRCFVESIGDSASLLVQTIVAKNGSKDCFVQSWVVDNNGKFLYAIARKDPPKGMKRNIDVRITKYRLPKLKEGSNVTLSNSDILDEFVVPFHNGVQGAIIRGNYLYIVTGLQEASAGEINAKRAIQVVDLEKRKLIKSIDLTYVTTNEPEDVDFYKKKCLLYCGQNGGIYQIKL